MFPFFHRLTDDFVRNDSAPNFLFGNLGGGGCGAWAVAAINQYWTHVVKLVQPVLLNSNHGNGEPEICIFE